MTVTPTTARRGPVLVVRDPEASAGELNSAEALARHLAPAFDGVVTAAVGGNGRPEDAILERARELDAGLIAVPAGRFRWAGVPRALEGPERALARRADRPVLLVPDGADWHSPPCYGVATDFSERAGLVARWTAAAARATGASLRLVHALEAPRVLSDAPPWIGGDWMEERIRDEACERLARLARELETEHRITVEPVDASGDTPWQVVCDIAAREELCLLGVGALGAGPDGGRLMGSTAEGILSRHGGAVAVVRGGVAAGGGSRTESIRPSRRGPSFPRPGGER